MSTPPRPSPPSALEPVAAPAAVEPSRNGHPVSPAPRPRRHWVTAGLLTVLLVVLGTGVGFGISLLLPTQYAARADLVYLLTREQPTGFLREDRNLSTQLVLLTSRTVLGPVADRSGIPVEDLADALTVSVVEESEVIALELRDGDPDRAGDVLDAIVDRYLAVSNNDERSAVRDYLDGELRTVLQRIDEVRAAQDPSGELGPLVDREQQLRTRLDELNLSDLAGPGARVLVAPYVVPDPVSPQPVVAAVTGGLAALLVAALAVALLVRRATGP